MYQGNIGDLSSQCDNVVLLSIPPGATVTVACLTASPSSVTYQSNGLGNAASGTIAQGANQAFTISPVYLTTTSAAPASIQITGTGY